MIIKELELNNIKQFKNTNIIPVFLQYGDECFEIASDLKQSDSAWSVFQKIFYYKLSETNKDYFEALYESRLFASEKNNGFIIFSKTDKAFNNDKATGNDTAVKFASNGYVRVERDEKKYNNLVILKKVLIDTKVSDIRIFVSLVEDLTDTNFKKEYNSLKKQFSRKKKNPYRIKKANLVVGHINGLILNDKEKLIKYVRSEYKKRNLLGDIVLDEKQEEILNSYMKIQLSRFVNNPSGFKPEYSRLFALGLVRYSMRNYNKRHSGDFWPHFKTDYDVEITGNNQKYLHEEFENIMNRYGMIYEKNATNKIDNITMHTFVADNSAFQLFDYLFDFWRLDLGRNSDNLNDEEGDYAFKSLIDAMQKGTQDVMTHTSLLLNFPKTKSSFKNRIKRILRLINDSFWNTVTINETGNRINHLLNQWIDEPKGAFQKEKNYVAKHSSYEKGETLFHSPVLSMSFDQNKLRIIFPHQRLIDCDENDYPEWIISSDSTDLENPIVITLNEHYKHDKIGFYAERISYDIPVHSMLSNFEFKLVSNGRELKKYKLAASNIRIFDAKGRNIDYKISIIPEGMIYAYSNSENYPTLLGEITESMEADGLRLTSMNLIKGQVIILDDNSGIQVGQKINEGLSENYPLIGVALNSQGKNYQIYNSLPKLLFKSSDDQISGVSLIINGKQNRVADKPFKEFKLSDDLKANGYLIDLNDYICSEGLYTIEISYPKMHVHHDFGMFAYIKNFKYRFDKNSYIFEDYATIIFDSRMNIIKDDKDNGEWNIKPAEVSFKFNFGERNENSENYCKDVIDCKLKRQYKVNGQTYDVYFDIPAFYWKYNESDEWNTQKPAPVLLKNLKQNIKKLFVKGPFNFNNSKIVTTDDVDIAEEESEIKFLGNKHPYFEITKIYDWFKNDRSVTYRNVFIVLDGLKENLFDVMCKSVLKDVSLIGDFENNILKGDVNIIGNEEYTITIYHDGKVVCEDEQIVDGHFQIEAEIETGSYKINVYEIADSDDNGFDVETDSILLNDKPIIKKLININDLEGKYIILKGYQDKQKKYLEHKFANEYVLRKLEKTSYNEIITGDTEIYGIWNNDIDIYDDDVMNSFTYYKAKLVTYKYDGKQLYLLDAIVVFTDHMNPESILILTKDEDELDYCSLYINRQKEWIISPYQRKKMGRYEKKECECFYDDKYYYFIDIEEE